MATNYENFNFHQNPQTFIEKIRQIFLIKSLGLRLLDTGTQVIMCQVLQFVGPDVSCTDIKSCSGSYRNIPLRRIQRVAILQGQTVHKQQIATFYIYTIIPLSPKGFRQTSKVVLRGCFAAKNEQDAK